MEITAFIKIYIAVPAFVLGAVAGSFINRMAYRIVHHESVLSGRSHCAVCGHQPKAADLIPIFSYIFLKGRCRYCKEKISPRYMTAELVMAAAFTAAALRFGFSLETPRAMVLACILCGLSLVDFDIYEIPDGFIIAGLILWGISLPIYWDSIVRQLVRSAIGGFGIGTAMLLLSLIFDKITKKNSLGGGDIKLIFMTGLFLGIWRAILTLIAACILGLVFSVVKKNRRIPFGPAISIAAYVCLLWGGYAINWYLGLF